MPSPTRPHPHGRHTGMRRGAELAARIRQDIVTGQFIAGDVLPSESEWAYRHNVSLRTVREALRELSEQELIHTRQGKRAVVAEIRPAGLRRYFDIALEISQDAADDLIELRITLESAATGLAAQRASSTELAALRRLVEDGNRFHYAILRAARNRFYTDVIESLHSTVYESTATKAICTATAKNRDVHRQIVTAIDMKDVATAEALMCHHLRANL